MTAGEPPTARREGELDPGVAAMLAAENRRQGPDLIDLPLERMREVFATGKLGREPPLPELASVRDLRVDGAAGPLRGRLYEPNGAAPRGPLLVYFHGGGFVIGSVETADGLCRRLAAAARLRVLSVGYRLAPEHPFPAAHDDAAAAVSWAWREADRLDIDRGRVAVGGDSAGANLAASAALALRGGAAGKLAFQLLLYPVTQYTHTTPSMQRFGEGYFLSRREMDFFRACLFGGANPAADPRLSVLEADLAGAPPALVVTAGFDPLRDDGCAYAEALRRAGVAVELCDYPGMIHGFFGLAGISPTVLTAVEETARKLAAALGSDPPSGTFPGHALAEPPGAA